MTALLEVRGLTVDFALGRQERLAIVGESGAGKSQLLLACTGLLAANGSAAGSVRYEGTELLGDADATAAIRGRGIGYVFQDAGASLTPHRRVGDALVEVATAARALSKREARAEAMSMLERVWLPEPASTFSCYPHELSGGMRQRVAIALALVTRPRVLFADEPTTALDVTLQAEVMALFDALCRDLGMALVLVTHDLGVVAALADQIAVMYAGRIVEEGAPEALLAQPRHPYTAGLLASVPTLADVDGGELATIAGQPLAPGEL
ncbi:MAG: ABC transporter ATP-binding protein, partial [Steroidobacteraceae bacterium]